jgi:hypothetical protein
MPRIGKSEDVEVQAQEKFEIEYRDLIPIFITKLFYYPEGVSLGKPGVRIFVTEKEKRRLLKHMNGNNPKFVEV